MATHSSVLAWRIPRAEEPHRPTPPAKHPTFLREQTNHRQAHRQTDNKRRRVQQRMNWLNGITDSTDVNSGKLREMVRNREAWYAVVHMVAESQTQLSD